MLKSLGAALCLLSMPVAAAAGVSDLKWLSGRWCGTNDGVFNEEVWMVPRGGSLLGMHRDSKQETLAGFEYFRIVEEGGELVYWTQPGGKPAIAFKGKPGAANSIAFTNDQHDFPKRIIYRRVDADTLLARIDDGTDHGPVMEWTWHLGCSKPE